MSFDEEPPRDPHDECRFEIGRLQAKNAALKEAITQIKWAFDPKSPAGQDCFRMYELACAALAGKDEE